MDYEKKDKHNILDELDSVKVGKRIKLERVRYGYSVRELAEIMHVHPHTIYQLENGTALPRLDTLTQLVITLDTTADYLLYGRTNTFDLSSP